MKIQQPKNLLPTYSSKLKAFATWRLIMKPLDFFPYRPRSDQRKVIEKIYRLASEGKNIVFQAPTGYGKTPVILSALLPLAIDFGLPIVWAVRTGGETDRVIEELEEIHKKIGGDLFGFSFRGKKDMCLLARNIGVKDFESVTELCRRVRKRCPYYINLGDWTSEELVKNPLLFSDIMDYGKSNELCPYYLQIYLLGSARVVSLSYNYILMEKFTRVLRSRLLKYGAFLVVDEAHNLDRVVSELYSIKISLNTIKRAINEINRYLANSELHEYVYPIIKSINLTLLREAESLKQEDAPFDAERFLDYLDLSEEELETIGRASERIIDLKLKSNKQPRSYLKSVKRFLEAMMENLYADGIEFIKYKDNDKVYFEVWNLNASEILQEIWSGFESIVFTSGTLKPYEAFAETIGIGNYDIIEGKFPIPEENILPIIYRGISTKGEELAKTTIDKYCQLLKSILKTFSKNLAVFNASYRIQSYFIDCLKETADEEGRPIFIEHEKMRGDELKKVYHKFVSSRNAVLVGTMGGRFAEGMDYPGEALEGIVLIGIPFDRINYRTQRRIEYYSKIYGDEKGRYYSYTVPALRRAAQAMGRAIRSPRDRVLIIAADDRYTYPTYFNLLPEYFVMNVKIVKSIQLLNKFIRAFIGDVY